MTPLYEGLVEALPNEGAARLWFNGSLVLSEISCLSELKAGSNPESMKLAQVPETEK